MTKNNMTPASEVRPGTLVRHERGYFNTVSAVHFNPDSNTVLVRFYSRTDGADCSPLKVNPDTELYILDFS